MYKLACIFIGGGLGSLLRYAFSYYNPFYSVIGLPFGTVLSNVFACGILGVVSGICIAQPQCSPLFRLFWAVGFCGGFSTFSTFILETHLLWQWQAMGMALLNIIVSLFACFMALYVGLYLGKLWWG